MPSKGIAKLMGARSAGRLLFDVITSAPSISSMWSKHETDTPRRHRVSTVNCINVLHYSH